MSWEVYKVHFFLLCWYYIVHSRFLLIVLNHYTQLSEFFGALYYRQTWPTLMLLQSLKMSILKSIILFTTL